MTQEARIDRTVAVPADTYVDLATPAGNHGSAAFLRVGGVAPSRVLVAFDTDEIVGAVDGALIVGVELQPELSGAAATWDPLGDQVVAHRMTTPWSEAGATRRMGCPTARVPGTWSVLAPPWEQTATDAREGPLGHAGVITFDVTSDVVAAGESGAGTLAWVVREGTDALPGYLDFMSREVGAAPRLALTLEGECLGVDVDDGNACTVDACALGSQSRPVRRPPSVVRNAV